MERTMEERREIMVEERREQIRMGHRWEVDIPLDLALLNSNRVWEAKILDLSLKGIRVGSSKIPLYVAPPPVYIPPPVIINP